MPPSASTSSTSSSSSTSALLAKIRSEIEAIPPHSLPSEWLPSTTNNNSSSSSNNDNNNTTPLLFDPALLTRYKTARDSYLLARTSQLFLSALSSYDAATGTFSFPAPPTEEDEEELKRGEEEVLREVKETMTRMDEKTTEVWDMWRGLEGKREELLGLLGEMEREERERRLVARGEGDGHLDDDVESGSDDDNSDDDEEVEITEEELQKNEQTLRDMQRRKSQLESKLRMIKAQILDAEDDVHRTKRAVNEVRVGCGQAPLEWRAHGDGDDCDGTSYQRVEEIVQEELREMERRHEKLKESKDYYDGMRELMEELGGVKILNSKTIVENSHGKEAEQENDEAVSESAGKRRKTDTSEQHKDETRGTTNEPLSQQHPQQNADFVLTMMLLDKHILELVVRNGKPENVESDDFHQNHDADSQRYVHSAKLKTDTSMPITNHDNNNNNNSDSNDNDNHSDEHTTTQQQLLQTIHDLSFTSTSLSKILSQTPSRRVAIPPLHDLVSFSHSFDTTQERIRFVVVETMARLRVMEARVWELDELKRRFVAVQIYDKEVAGDDVRDRVDDGNGETEGEGENASTQPQPHPGAEQEVVIAIDEGITLAMRLGADCPLLPGSVYISEMFGMGAWKESQLEELKRAVVQRRCMGPVEVMEVILEEIARRRENGEWKGEEEGLTPCLPGVGGGRMMME